MSARADGLPHPATVSEEYLVRMLDENRAFHKEALSLLGRKDDAEKVDGDEVVIPGLRLDDELEKLQEPESPVKKPKRR